MHSIPLFGDRNTQIPRLHVASGNIWGPSLGLLRSLREPGVEQLTGANKDASAQRTSPIYVHLRRLRRLSLDAATADSLEYSKDHTPHTHAHEIISTFLCIHHSTTRSLLHHAAITSTKAGRRSLPNLEHPHRSHGTHCFECELPEQSVRSSRSEHRAAHLPVQEAAIRAGVSGVSPPMLPN